MMLRSSSTPVLGSLLSSYSESPSSEPHPTIKHRLPSNIHHNPINKFSFHHPTIPCNSSPISPSIADLSINGFRRAHSDGNLQGLLVTAGSCNHNEFSISMPPKRPSRRPNCSMLETIPSFSIHNARNRCENEDYSDKEEEEEEEEENGALFGDSIEGEEKSMAVRGSKLDLEKQHLGLKDEMGFVKGNGSLLAFEEKIGAEMYLARGLGADSIKIGFGGGCGGGGGGGGGHNGGGGSGSAGGGNGDGPSIEEHYKRLVEENPGNPLFLRNYAQFLYETNGDLPRAEEFYSRAILADPKDGEVLSQYAKLIWELHGDQDRASSYFERAVCAAPQDSHVHAAYASFLWETEEERDEDDATNDPTALSSNFHGTMAPATA